MTTPIIDEELEKAAILLLKGNLASTKYCSADIKFAFIAGARYQAEKMRGEIDCLIEALQFYAQGCTEDTEHLGERAYKALEYYAAKTGWESK